MVADSICTAHGWTYSDIWKFFPRYINERQRKVELPTRRDLYDLIEGDARLTTYADNLIRRQPKISSVLNVTDFYSLSKNIYEEHIRQRFEIAAEEDMYRRAYVEAVTTWLYEDEYIDWSFAVPPVSQWLAERGLPAYSGDIKLSGDLVTNIFIAATGMDGTDFNTLKGIQNAMVSIMGGLSSYSVQFLKSINSTDVIPLNYPVVRAGDVRGFSHDSKELPISPGYVHLEGVAKSILTEEISVETPVLSSKVYIKSMPLDVSMSKELRHDTIGLIDCYLSTIQTSASYPGYSSAISSKQSFINYEQFDSLTVAQKIAVFNGGVIPVTPAPTSPTASQTTGLAASFTGTVKVINPSTGKTVATYDIPPDTLEDVQTDMLAHPTYTIVATPAVVAKFKVINTDSSTTTTAVISTSATFNASSLQVLSGTDSSVVSGASVSNTSAVAGVYEWTVSIPPMPPNPPFVPRASVTWTE
jgi:hypothetical protein